MAQAKRKSKPKSVTNHRPSFQGLGVLLAGMVIGSLATLLWQGMQATDDGIGAGIRQMMTQSEQQGQQSTTQVREENKPAEQKTPFSFYTVLPAIEVVVPTPAPDSPPTPQSKTVDKTTDSNSSSTYMLQAGSYKNRADADRLKAKLAFQGLVAAIQKISIQDRGDFYRVRLGPYTSYDEMVSADQKIGQQGIKSLRLKISKGG